MVDISEEEKDKIIANLKSRDSSEKGMVKVTTSREQPVIKYSDIYAFITSVLSLFTNPVVIIIIMYTWLSNYDVLYSMAVTLILLISSFYPY